MAFFWTVTPTASPACMLLAEASEVDIPDMFMFYIATNKAISLTGQESCSRPVFLSIKMLHQPDSDSSIVPVPVMRTMTNHTMPIGSWMKMVMMM